MRAGLVAFGLALAACGGEPPIGDGRLELGGTDESGQGFVAFGGDVTLVPGSQGGFHVWLKFRTRGISPGTVSLLRTARRASDGRLLLRAEGPAELGVPGPSGYFEIESPIPSFMCPSPLGTRVMDERVVFLLEVRDQSGALLASASAEATPRCPTGDQAQFCSRICSG